MSELIATVDSLEQAQALLAVGVDTIVFGEEQFGLRLPHSFSREEQKTLVQLAHEAGKKASVAVNGIMHPEKMTLIPEYLAFLAEIQADQILVGDPGVVYVLKKHPEWQLPYIYDGETLVTSARQINFWGKKGAIGAVLAREVPFGEMQIMGKELQIPAEVLVYGPTCIHQSKRPLLQNYYNYTQQTEETDRSRGLFLSEPKKPETHYSIYEDSHGTHVFATNDVDLMKELGELAAENFSTWKLDGLFCPGEAFVAIAKAFQQARQAIDAGTWSLELAEKLNQQVIQQHPQLRGLDTGFYYIDPDEIK